MLFEHLQEGELALIYAGGHRTAFVRLKNEVCRKHVVQYPNVLGDRKHLEEQGTRARNRKDCCENFEMVENGRRRKDCLLKKLIM